MKFSEEKILEIKELQKKLVTQIQEGCELLRFAKPSAVKALQEDVNNEILNRFKRALFDHATLSYLLLNNEKRSPAPVEDEVVDEIISIVSKNTANVASANKSQISETSPYSKILFLCRDTINECIGDMLDEVRKKESDNVSDDLKYFYFNIYDFVGIPNGVCKTAKITSSPTPAGNILASEPSHGAAANTPNAAGSGSPDPRRGSARSVIFSSKDKTPDKAENNKNTQNNNCQ